MKKFLKNMIEFYNQEIKNNGNENQEYTRFISLNTNFIESFDSKIKEFEKGIDNLFFANHDCEILSHSKKHNTVEIKSTFYKKNNDNPTIIEEDGFATIIFTLNNFSKNIQKIKEKKLIIYGLYFEKGTIGCIYIEKNKLNYFIEENSVELSFIKSVTIDFSSYKEKNC